MQGLKVPEKTFFFFKRIGKKKGTTSRKKKKGMSGHDVSASLAAATATTTVAAAAANGNGMPAASTAAALPSMNGTVHPDVLSGAEPRDAVLPPPTRLQAVQDVCFEDVSRAKVSTWPPARQYLTETESGQRVI